MDNGDFVGDKGEQGIQGEQGPQGPPGEVTQEEFDNLSQEVAAHKEDYATQRQQDQLKVATIEKELNDYKSTLANINVNQEVKQKVSGYGSVSLPKNAANGQVSVSLKGDTVTDENGTKSTISASRLKSVDKDGIQESTQYLPNVGELRSLPNGTKDEVRISDGKAEHIQRNKQNVLQASDISKFSTGNVNNDFVSIRKEIFTDIISPGADIHATKMNTPITSPRLGKGFDQADNVWTHSFDANNTMLIFVPKGTYSSLADAQSKLTGLELTYQLAEPIVTPIKVSGTLLSNPSGTVYVENVVADAGIYDSSINVLHQDLPIDYVEKLSKVDFTTGLETELDISKVVVSEDRKSFTHPNLVDGDIIFFTYFHNIEGTEGELSMEYYDSRHVLKDTVTGKFYKIVQTVTDGVLTDTLVEV